MYPPSAFYARRNSTHLATGESAWNGAQSLVVRQQNTAFRSGDPEVLLKEEGAESTSWGRSAQAHFGGAVGALDCGDNPYPLPPALSPTREASHPFGGGFRFPELTMEA